MTRCWVGPSLRTHTHTHTPKSSKPTVGPPAWFCWRSTGLHLNPRYSPHHGLPSRLVCPPPAWSFNTSRTGGAGGAGCPPGSGGSILHRGYGDVGEGPLILGTGREVSDHSHQPQSSVTPPDVESGCRRSSCSTSMEDILGPVWPQHDGKRGRVRRARRMPKIARAETHVPRLPCPPSKTQEPQYGAPTGVSFGGGTFTPSHGASSSDDPEHASEGKKWVIY